MRPFTVSVRLDSIGNDCEPGSVLVVEPTVRKQAEG